MPRETLAAYRERGHPALRLEEDLLEAMALADALERLGISLDAASEELERDGVRKFVEPFDRLLAVRRERVRLLRAGA